MNIRFFLPLLLLALPPAVFGTDSADERGKDVYGPCAACHGESGAGGKRGEYPRIAGQRPTYLIEQLLAFQKRTRVNLPMFPYTEERELSESDMQAVSQYLAAIKLPNRMPDFKGTEDALTRLEMVDKVMIIPRVEGDLNNGKRVYESACLECHGKLGTGTGGVPMLVGQYTAYLQKQIDAYLRAERPHDEDSAKAGSLYKLKASEIQDVLAYLTVLQYEN